MEVEPTVESAVPTSQDSEHEEEAFSIARTGTEAAFLRQRTERPARIGRLVLGLLGSITLAAGVVEWLTARSVVGLALGLFGGILLALGVVQHYLYERDKSHWPDRAILWNDGVELVLHNEEVRGITWQDSDLAIDLVDRRAPPPANREYLLVWMMDSRVPPVEISEDGFERLTRATLDRGLLVSQSRRGLRPDATRFVEIRQVPAGATPGVSQIAAAGTPNKRNHL